MLACWSCLRQDGGTGPGKAARLGLINMLRSRQFHLTTFVVLPQTHCRALADCLWPLLQALHALFRALAAFLTRFAQVREERLRNPPRQAQPQLQWHGPRSLQQQDPGESPAKRRRIANARHEELNRWGALYAGLQISMEGGQGQC